MLLFSISPIASPVSLTPKWQTGCVVDRKFNTATGWIPNNYSDVPNSLPTHLLLFSCSPLFFFQLNQLDAMNQPKRQQHVTSQAEWHQSYLAWWTLVNAVRFIHFICYYLIVFSCLASQPTYPMVFDWFTSTKDRKAILHPGLCKDSLFLGIAFTHPLLYSFQRCQSRWYIMPAIEQDHKRNTVAGFNMSRDAIGVFNILHLWHQVS